MSRGGWIGAVVGLAVGAVIGFVIGGPAGAVTGALWGASLGFAAGIYIDPMTPDIPSSTAPLPAGAEVMTTIVGNPLPDLTGTAKITGHLLCFGKERTETIYTEVEGGKDGGDSPDPQVTGYKYYMSWAVGIVAGPIDTLYAIYKNNDLVWEGELDLPTDSDSFGQETIVLDGMGSVTFYFGTDDQIANSKVGEIIGDETLNSPYRHFCWCFLDDCCIGEYNRAPTMKFILRKSPVVAFSEDGTIQIYDYNPMHTIWYILHDLVGLPEAWLHSDDFAAAALTLAGETRGISCLFVTQQSAVSYLENINAHMDGIIRYGSDGKFHPKLIRDDYVVDDLPLIDENVMLDDPTLKRKSWIDTVNEVKVQYTEIVNVSRASNIYNLFGSENVIFGVYFSGNNLSFIGAYDSVESITGLLLRDNELITMAGTGTTAELRRIGITPNDAKEYPLLGTNPIANQYDVIGSYGLLTYDSVNDRIFYTDTAVRNLSFNGLERHERGFYNVVTRGTDGNLYTADYVYTTWTHKPITDPNWGIYWRLIEDNVCDSPIKTFGIGTCYTGLSDRVDSVYYNGYCYILIAGSPYTFLRKIDPDSHTIIKNVSMSPSFFLAAGNLRIYVVKGVVGVIVVSYDSGSLTLLAESVILSGMMGAITVSGNFVYVITRPYAGGASGIYKLNSVTLEVVDSYMFPAEIGNLLYQTLVPIQNDYLAAGRNNGISVFSINPLARIADLSYAPGYGSIATVVQDM